MTTQSSGASPGTELLILTSLTMARQADGSIRLTLVAATTGHLAGRRVVYRETFGNWDTALDIAPYLARPWARGVIPGEHHDEQ